MRGLTDDQFRALSADHARPYAEAERARRDSRRHLAAPRHDGRHVMTGLGSTVGRTLVLVDQATQATAWRVSAPRYE